MWCWSSGGEEQGKQSMQTPCWHSWVSCGLVSGCFFFVVFSSFTVLFEDRCFILLHGFSIKLLCGTSASAQVLHLHICREAWTERCKHMYFYASVLLPGPAPWLICFSWASLPTVKAQAWWWGRKSSDVFPVLVLSWRTQQEHYREGG